MYQSIVMMFKPYIVTSAIILHIYHVLICICSFIKTFAITFKSQRILFQCIVTDAMSNQTISTAVFPKFKIYNGNAMNVAFKIPQVNLNTSLHYWIKCSYTSNSTTKKVHSWFCIVLSLSIANVDDVPHRVELQLNKIVQGYFLISKNILVFEQMSCSAGVCAVYTCGNFVVTLPLERLLAAFAPVT